MFIRRRTGLFTALALGGSVLLGLAGCGGSATTETQSEATEQRPMVLEPLAGTLDRARGVQQTVDGEAAEMRKRLEQAER